MMYPIFAAGVGFVSFLVFASFWIGVACLLVWVSRQKIHERELLVGGLTAVLAGLFLVSLIMFAWHLTWGGSGGLMGCCGARDGGFPYGWMMGSWYGR